ncbi:RNA metabolism protein [Lithospermum erythrorhizon]|uniref:RNA metabolism protein n=1 Tax=Lithospermum erythrorhizon TaxID=34254 RepID=A0AAV3RTR6_LITER
MPSETMDSSSFFSKELSFCDERQLGFWKTDEINKCYARYSSNNISYGPSVNADDHHEEKESFESLKELEAQTIGNLLPDDDDDLFYGVTDAKKNHSEEDFNQGTIVAFNLDSSVSNDELRQIFGYYGEVKEIHETLHRSQLKIIEFYDAKAADAALRALNNSGIAGKKITHVPSHLGGPRWSIDPFSFEMDQEHPGLHLQQSSPPSNFPLGYSGSFSHGGITSNLDNGTVMSARPSGRPPMSPYRESAFHNGISSSVPNRSSSLPNLLSPNNQSNFMEGSSPHGKFEIWGPPGFRSDSLPDYGGSFANGSICKSPGNMTLSRVSSQSELQEKSFGRLSPKGLPTDWNENVFSASPNGNCLSSGQHYMWSSSSQPQGVMWPNSPSFVNGTCSPRPQQMHAIARPPSHLPSGLAQMNIHTVGSPRSVNPSLWERRHGYAAESPVTSPFNLGSPGGLRIPRNSPHLTELSPHNMFLCNAGSPMDSVHSQNIQLHPQNQAILIVPTRGQLSPLLSPFESPNERTRGRRSDGSSNQSDKKQFELDIERIMLGEDKRTTLMIKNIPNKYTSKMLLAAIDECHKGTYDFLYLPIDFKNKCNVGYAFINMTDTSLIVPFYQAFNGKKWEKFNSEKVTSLTYARIQGKAALVAHFQNSSLMNEDKRCRPILFNTDGPNAGDQVPFPIGGNIRSRTKKIKSSSSQENIQDILPDSPNEEEF